MRRIGKKLEKVIVILLIAVLYAGVVSSVKVHAGSITSNKLSTASNTKNSELKGVWISYLEFLSAGVNTMSKTEFHNYIDLSLIHI